MHRQPESLIAAGVRSVFERIAGSFPRNARIALNTVAFGKRASLSALTSKQNGAQLASAMLIPMRPIVLLSAISG